MSWRAMCSGNVLPTGGQICLTINNIIPAVPVALPAGALPDLPLGSLTTTLAPALAPVSGVVNTVCNTLDAAVP